MRKIFYLTIILFLVVSDSYGATKKIKKLCGNLYFVGVIDDAGIIDPSSFPNSLRICSNYDRKGKVSTGTGANESVEKSLKCKLQNSGTQRICNQTRNVYIDGLGDCIAKDKFIYTGEGKRKIDAVITTVVSCPGEILYGFKYSGQLTASYY